MNMTTCFVAIAILSGGTDGQARPARDDADLEFWLTTMGYHGYTPEEVSGVLGLPADGVPDLWKRFKTPAGPPTRGKDEPPLVVPYPGGRHPRIGFLEGAVDPQRETKVSVFTPWADGGYVVADVPEALWSNLGLTYLAHEHVPTIWSKAGVVLPRLEWAREPDGSWTMRRALPNGISFGTRVVPVRGGVWMEQWLTNGTDRTLTDLRVQNCVMLKGARGFEAQTDENKVTRKPYVAARSADGRRWTITAWEPCHRPWNNPPVPCLHSDPRFPDCEPGRTQRLVGWLSFHEGEDVEAEFDRLDSIKWRDGPGRD